MTVWENGNNDKVSQKFGKVGYLKVSTNPGKIKEALEESKEIEIISNSYFFSTTRNEGEDFFY